MAFKAVASESSPVPGPLAAQDASCEHGSHGVAEPAHASVLFDDYILWFDTSTKDCSWRSMWIEDFIGVDAATVGGRVVAAATPVPKVVLEENVVCHGGSLPFGLN